jgi:hypothetical protein
MVTPRQHGQTQPRPESSGRTFNRTPQNKQTGSWKRKDQLSQHHPKTHTIGGLKPVMKRIRGEHELFERT